MGVKEYNLIETILNVELINFISKMNVECVLVIREDFRGIRK